ncbi:MAG: hypothetical protein QOI77_1836 [Blastocatellia bacterium]|nr:hypothetical protein [Blastocatellia bacterium]
MEAAAVSLFAPNIHNSGRFVTVAEYFDTNLDKQSGRRNSESLDSDTHSRKRRRDRDRDCEIALVENGH